MSTTQTQPSTKSIKELVQLLGADDRAAAFGAYQELLEKILPATSYRSRKKNLHASVAAELVKELTSKVEVNVTPKKKRNNKEVKKKVKLKPAYSAGVRNKILRLLSFVTGPGQIVALTEALNDFELREMAIYALDRNKSAKATNALISALNQVGTDFRVGVVNYLSKRREGNVLGVLRKTASGDSDPEVRMAAVEALATFPEPANEDVMVKAADSDCKCIRSRAQKARVRLAETLVKHDKLEEAKNIYKAILAGDTGEAPKKAARIGLDLIK